MLTCERLIVHFVAQQTLRVPGRRHVQRFVVIIRTLDGDEPRCGIGPDHLQKIRQPRAAKAPDDVPSLDANMPRVLPELGQRLDLRQRVVSRLLHCAANGEGPIVEIHSGIVDGIAIDTKTGKGRKFGIVESARQVAGAEEPGRSPIAESEPGLEQRLLELRKGESPQRQHWAELEQFTTIYSLELPAIGSKIHLTPY